MNPLAETLDSLGPFLPTLSIVGAAMATASRFVWGYAKGVFERRETRRQKAEDDREKERLARIGYLEGELSHERQERERERGEALATALRLGSRIDEERALVIEERKLRDRDAERMTLAILRRSTPAQASSGAEDWADVPTAVHNALELAKEAAKPATSDPFPQLQRFDPYRKTTPPDGTPSR